MNKKQLERKIDHLRNRIEILENHKTILPETVDIPLEKPVLRETCFDGGIMSIGDRYSKTLSPKQAIEMIIKHLGIKYRDESIKPATLIKKGKQ